MNDLSCFKAYDIRGRVPDQLNEELAYRLGRAFVHLFASRRVVVGHDIRLSSPALSTAVAQGLLDGGADVLDIGLCGTEEVYFATFHNESSGVDGGIAVTASHNPKDYNGMKLVGPGSRPISGDSGLRELQQLVEEASFDAIGRKGALSTLDSRPDYVNHLLGYVDASALEGLRIVVNAGNGGAGLAIDALEPHLPVEFIKIQHQPDGNFPNGIPNPLLVDNRQSTIEAVLETQADFGIAWDGDFDRCFLFDENGSFIEGYYIVGLLAQAFLQKYPGQKVVHDPRLIWNTIDIVESHGGQAIMSKTGHAFIKERMRLEDAIYGGEMSAHHYFKQFAYCDSGMIPWLLVAELIRKSGRSLSELVREMIVNYPVSGEINRTVEDPEQLMRQVAEVYQPVAAQMDYTDGLSMSFENWRFSLRRSNTEPLVRLNVESRADHALMEEKTAELLALIN